MTERPYDESNPRPGTTPISLPGPGAALSTGQRAIYVIVLGALVALGPFTIDLYLPAFPVVQAELGVDETAIQLTLSATIIGFALGQLFVGPWSDAVGRRLPLLIMTGVHVIASVGVVLAPNVELIGLARLFQGVGAAGGGVVAMAMVRDLFRGYALVRMFSRLALVTGLAPIIAPVIGSQLLRIIDWRGIFVVLAAYGVVVGIVAALLIVETRTRQDRLGESHGSVRSRYAALFRDRIFLGVALIGGMNFSSLFAYLASSSFLLQDVYGLDAQQYGVVFGLNSLGLAVSSQVSSRLIRRVGPQWVLAFTIPIMLTAVAIIGIGTALGGGLPVLLVGLFILLSGAGATFPAVQVTALVHHGEEAGTAASVLGAVNFGLAGAISPIVGALGISAIAMASVQAVCLLVALASLWIIVRPRTVPPIE